MHRLVYSSTLVFGAVLIGLAVFAISAGAEEWVHPAGLLDAGTVEEIKRELAAGLPELRPGVC